MKLKCQKNDVSGVGWDILAAACWWRAARPSRGRGRAPERLSAAAAYTAKCTKAAKQVARAAKTSEEECQEMVLDEIRADKIENGAKKKAQRDFCSKQIRCTKRSEHGTCSTKTGAATATAATPTLSSPANKSTNGPPPIERANVLPQQRKRRHFRMKKGGQETIPHVCPQNPPDNRRCHRAGDPGTGLARRKFPCNQSPTRQALTIQDQGQRARA